MPAASFLPATRLILVATLGGLVVPTTGLALRDMGLGPIGGMGPRQS